MEYKGSKVIETKLTNKKVVITGSITGGTREDIKSLLVSYGANVSTSPSAKTEVLFVGEKASENKINKASNNGSKVVALLLRLLTGLILVLRLLLVLLLLLLLILLLAVQLLVMLLFLQATHIY